MKKLTRTYVIIEHLDNQEIPIYVGSTSQVLRKRFNSHYNNKQTAVSRYIRLEGKENFEIRELAVFNTLKKALDHEAKMVMELKTFENGLNQTKNGQCNGPAFGEKRKTGKTRTTIIDGIEYKLPVGVYSFDNPKSHQKLRVAVRYNKKYKTIGYYSTVSEAVEIYNTVTDLIVNQNVTLIAAKNAVTKRI